jgi:hypothetical protein
MNRLQLIQRVRSLTRDFSNSIFRETDIVDYINEGIERITQYIPECRDMNTLDLNTDEVQYLPKSYHSILALYSASRCFFQDERFFQLHFHSFYNPSQKYPKYDKNILDNIVNGIYYEVPNSK